MGAAHIELGRAGEDLAVRWYREHGYDVLARNWRCPIGEIDIVVRSGSTLVVAEVKTRRTAAFGVPALAVTDAKRRRLRRLAAAWLAAHRLPARVDVRFDVASITGTQVDVYENAF